MEADDVAVLIKNAGARNGSALGLGDGRAAWGKVVVSKDQKEVETAGGRVEELCLLSEVGGDVLEPRSLPVVTEHHSAMKVVVW